MNEIVSWKYCKICQLAYFLSFQPEDEPKEEATPTKPVVGIIYPPPEVRNIVDKTASFVAR